LRRCVNMAVRTPPSTSSAELLQIGSNCMIAPFGHCFSCPRCPVFSCFSSMRNIPPPPLDKKLCTQDCLCKFCPRCGRSLSTVQLNRPTGRDLRNTPTQ
jgi:hypothetical protein